jgi:hypothetical protein
MIRGCFEPGDLIEYLDGEAPPERVREIEDHLAGCDACRAYLASIEQAFRVLRDDEVPEPPPAYWAYFEKSVRQRIASRKRHRALRLVPALAGIAALVLIVVLWWPFRPELGLDGVDIVLSTMSTGEMVETLGSNPDAGLALSDIAEDQIRSLEAYLIQTDDLDDLLGHLTEAEAEELESRLSEIMKAEESTSGIFDDSKRKGCRS